MKCPNHMHSAGYTKYLNIANSEMSNALQQISVKQIRIQGEVFLYTKLQLSSR